LFHSSPFLCSSFPKSSTGIFVPRCVIWCLFFSRRRVFGLPFLRRRPPAGSTSLDFFCPLFLISSGAYDRFRSPGFSSPGARSPISSPCQPPSLLYVRKLPGLQFFFSSPLATRRFPLSLPGARQLTFFFQRLTSLFFSCGNVPNVLRRSPFPPLFFGTIPADGPPARPYDPSIHLFALANVLPGRIFSSPNARQH